MPPVPPNCQQLENEVDQLKVDETSARANLATLSGEAAWRTLVTLGNIRGELDKKEQELQTCISNNSAALSANLVVMQIDPPGASEPSRVAHLWDVSQGSRIVRETSPVQANGFVFKGPLPADFGISVLATGLPDVTGPDFCATIPAGTPVAPARVEVLIGPAITIGLQALLTQLSPSGFTAHKLDISGAITVNFSIKSTTAEIVARHLIGQLTGDAAIQVAGQSNIQHCVFTARASVNMVPLGEPGTNIFADFIVPPIVDVEMPGLIGAIATQLLPLFSDQMSKQFVERFRAAILGLIDAEIQRVFVVNLPNDVTISIRRLVIDENGITFQPTLSAVGDRLSKFTVAALPPP